jgi:hypothetical protein
MGALDDLAICVECGERRQVWNDSGYRELPDGTIEHDDPVCEMCTIRERARNRASDAWDAYESGRPMSSDDY